MLRPLSVRRTERPAVLSGVWNSSQYEAHRSRRYQAPLPDHVCKALRSSDNPRVISGRSTAP